MTVLLISYSIPKLFPSNKIQYLAVLSPRKQLKTQFQTLCFPLSLLFWGSKNAQFLQFSLKFSLHIFKSRKQTGNQVKFLVQRILLVLCFCLCYILVMTIIILNQKGQENNTFYIVGIPPYPLDLSLNKKKMYFFELTGEFKFLEAENIDRVIGFL